MVKRKRFHPPLSIDSGAFSAFQQDDKIDLGEWMDFCQTVGKRYADTEYVNLDVISMGRGDENAARASYGNWLVMREAGLDPMPVYHVNTDVKWLSRYLKRTDYIGLGAMAKMPDRRRVVVLDRLWRDHLMDSTGRPRVKVHGMDMSSFTLMKRYPWYSFDSTTWMMQASYGRIYTPRTKGGRWDFTTKPINVVVSADNPAAKDHGKHYCTMSPLRQATIRRFLEKIDLPLGKLNWDGDKGRGILNDYYARCCMNALVMARHIATYKHKPRLLLSGKIPVENYMRLHPEHFPGDTGIMLSFYSINHSENTICAKRLRAFEANRPVEFMKTRKKRKKT